MCGLVAMFRRDGARVLEDEIVRMRDLLAHRGPDDAGLFLDGPVGLGHRRLNIIDLAGGHQPMANERGTVQVVFNGEIYNYRALRDLLLSKGVHLRTKSDTETILGLYDLYGDDCVEHLTGMFAFVLWDSARRRLLAARDRLGIKPLYVLRHGATVAFASEIKAFLPVAGWTPALASEHLPEYLVYRNLAGTATLVRGVERVAPGELIVLEGTNEHRRQYWRTPLPGAEPAAARSAAAWEADFEQLLGDVIRDHMISDVPLGTFNSGGVDSSLVTAFVAAEANERLNTYSVGFDEAAFDERPYADIVAARYGTNHTSVVVDGREYAELLPRTIWHHDEPLNHPHSPHLLYLSRIARQKVTVVLTGEGSDELFAGYPRYRLARLLDRLRIPVSVLGVAAKLAGRALSERERLRIAAVLSTDGGVDLRGLAAFVAWPAARRVLSGDAVAPLSTLRAAPGTLLAHALQLDQETYLQSLLNRLDKMNMAASLEGRVPFLDHRVVEFAARVPAGLKLRGRETKYLVKAVARRHLPEKIVDRRKAGFAVPVTAWLRPGGPLAEYLALLTEPRALERGFLDAGAVRTLVDEHRRAERDHGELLWALVNLELWHRVMLDNPNAAAGFADPAPPLAASGGERRR